MALIYIVEDDEPIRRELADILARAGFEVEACESFEHVSRDILAAAPLHRLPEQLYFQRDGCNIYIVSHIFFDV